MALIITIFIFAVLWAIIKSAITPTTQPKKQQISRPTPTYSPHTIRSTPKPTKEREIIVRTLDIPDDEEDGIYESKIAGITKYCKPADEGVFYGVIYNEYENPYDHKAMAIVSMNKKTIGYIPNDVLYDYRSWSKSQPFPCVGFIKRFTNDRGENIVFGRVYAIKPCNADFVKRMNKAYYEDLQEDECIGISRV